MISDKTLTEFLAIMAVTAVVGRVFFLDEWLEAAKVVMNVF
jgi:hypothetical protein